MWPSWSPPVRNIKRKTTNAMKMKKRAQRKRERRQTRKAKSATNSSSNHYHNIAQQQQQQRDRRNSSNLRTQPPSELINLAETLISSLNWSCKIRFIYLHVYTHRMPHALCLYCIYIFASFHSSECYACTNFYC